MNTISDRDRAEAQAMFEAFHGGAPIALSDGSVRRWLAVRDHALAAHECPTVPDWVILDGPDRPAREVVDYLAERIKQDPHIKARKAVAEACHVWLGRTPAPEWRPVIDGEDLTGYEVRSRDRDRDVWDAWGVAARRRNDGRWVTEGGWRLNGWPVVETTAPLPEPEPWPEELVGVVSDALAGDEGPGHHWVDDARRVLDALAARGYLERPKAGA